MISPRAGLLLCAAALSGCITLGRYEGLPHEVSATSRDGITVHTRALRNADGTLDVLAQLVFDGVYSVAAEGLDTYMLAAHQSAAARAARECAPAAAHLLAATDPLPMALGVSARYRCGAAR